ncbi:hypothetical protein ACWIGM_09005 [Bosea sp. NPDC055332]
MDSTVDISCEQRSFNSAIRAAQIWLMADAPYRALAALRLALKQANKLGRYVAATVLRVMNWVRAHIVRSA